MSGWLMLLWEMCTKDFLGPGFFEDVYPTNMNDYLGLGFFESIAPGELLPIARKFCIGIEIEV